MARAATRNTRKPTIAAKAADTAARGPNAPRGTNVVYKAFNDALGEYPIEARPDIMKAALSKLATLQSELRLKAREAAQKIKAAGKQQVAAPPPPAARGKGGRTAARTVSDAPPTRRTSRRAAATTEPAPVATKTGRTRRQAIASAAPTTGRGRGNRAAAAAATEAAAPPVVDQIGD